MVEKSETPASKKSTWISKADQTSLGDIRKKYPTAFWVVGGIILVTLIF